ncbi:unnamed protein product, partial [Acanthocheilonema viteae]
MRARYSHDSTSDDNSGSDVRRQQQRSIGDNDGNNDSDS